MKKINITFNAPVTLLFVIACGAALLANYLTGGTTTTSLFSVYRSSMTSPLTYVRMFTHVFGYISFQQFATNMLIILILGTLLEGKHGSGSLFMVIAVTALSTGVLHFIIGSGTIMGANGIVYAMILLAAFTDFRSGEIPLTLLAAAGLFISGQILGDFSGANILSNLSSLVGGAVGIISGFLLNIRKA